MLKNKNIAGLSKYLYAYFQQESGLYKFVNGKQIIFFSNELARQTIEEHLGVSIDDVKYRNVMLEIKDYLDKLTEKIYEVYPKYSKYLEKNYGQGQLKTAVIYAHGYELDGKWVYAGEDEYFYSVEDLIKYQKKNNQLVLLMVCNPGHLSLAEELSKNTVIIYPDNTLSIRALNEGDVNLTMISDGHEIDAYTIDSIINEVEKEKKIDVDDVMDKWGF